MKKFIWFFLLGIAVVILGENIYVHYYQTRISTPASAMNPVSLFLTVTPSDPTPVEPK